MEPKDLSLLEIVAFAMYITPRREARRQKLIAQGISPNETDLPDEVEQRQYEKHRDMGLAIIAQHKHLLAGTKFAYLLEEE